MGGGERKEGGEEREMRKGRKPGVERRTVDGIRRGRWRGN